MSSQRRDTAGETTVTCPGQNDLGLTSPALNHLSQMSDVNKAVGGLLG